MLSARYGSVPSEMRRSCAGFSPPRGAASNPRGSFLSSNRNPTCRHSSSRRTNSRLENITRRQESTGSSRACGRSATGRRGHTSIRAASRRTRRRTTISACSGNSRLADPRMVQGLPAEAERRLAIRRVMVEGRDENSVDDGPEGAEDEPIKDRGDGPRQAAGLSDDSPHERDKADREQEKEHESRPQDSALMG